MYFTDHEDRYYRPNYDPIVDWISVRMIHLLAVYTLSN